MGTQHGPRPAIWQCGVSEVRDHDDHPVLVLDQIAYGRTAEDAEHGARVIAEEWRPLDSDSRTHAEPDAFAARIPDDVLTHCDCCGELFRVRSLRLSGPDQFLIGLSDELACVPCLVDADNEQHAEAQRVAS